MPVAGVRTVMVGVPAMMSDLIKRLAVGRVQLDIVSEIPDVRAIARRLATLRPALIVIGVEDAERDDKVRALLGRLPAARVIAVASDGRMTGYELCVRRTKLSELSTEGLIAFIREARADMTAPRG
ncbi:hypothetical protein [Rhodoblastus sp.]|uniref:hypothetical protein n=1 Tax=Rhodoblastus sp. TaxID=1962975 RepID=UPI003F9C0887